MLVLGDVGIMFLGDLCVGRRILDLKKCVAICEMCVFECLACMGCGQVCVCW